MATVQPIEPEKPVDLVAYEPVMLALSKARAAQYLLEFLDSEHSEPLATFKMQEPKRITEHLGWIRQFGHDALVAALDAGEAAYRKLGTEGRRLV